MLRMAGCIIPEAGTEGTYAGILISFPPICVLLPSFGTSPGEVKDRFGPGGGITMSGNSAIVLQGDVTFEGRVEVEGALVVRALNGAYVTVKRLSVKNQGWEIVKTSEGEGDDMHVMRGYKVSLLVYSFPVCVFDRGTLVFPWNDGGKDWVGRVRCTQNG